MEEKRGMKTYKVIMLVLLVAFITFILTTIGMYKYFTGTGFGKSLVSSSNANNEIANELNKYRKIIDKYYLGDVDEEKLKEGAIKGYIEGLGDKYSEYISKEDMEDYSVVIYVVKSGDTLWKIAKRFGSTVDDIARVNGMERPDKLNIGEKIYIPKYVLKRAKEPIVI